MAVIQSHGWRHEPPAGRVFALVLVRGSSEPRVAQFEPGFSKWVFRDGSPVQPDYCEWHPLPWHPSFHEVTHAMEAQP